MAGGVGPVVDAQTSSRRNDAPRQRVLAVDTGTECVDRRSRSSLIPIKVAEIKDLRFIGQVLSLIQDQGIKAEWSRRSD